MTKILIVLIGLLVLLNACINQTNENIVLQAPVYFQDSLARIEGQWYWVKSSGGINGITIVPTVDDQIRLRYSKDSVYQFIRTERVVNTSKYFIKKNKSIYQQDSINFIYYSDYQQHYDVILKLTKDSLVFADNYFDGFSRLYVKLSL